MHIKAKALFWPKQALRDCRWCWSCSLSSTPLLHSRIRLWYLIPLNPVTLVSENKVLFSVIPPKSLCWQMICTVMRRRSCQDPDHIPWTIEFQCVLDNTHLPISISLCNLVLAVPPITTFPSYFGIDWKC